MGNKLKHDDLFKVGDILRVHCKSVNGNAVYEAGWDDELILAEVQEKYPNMSIKISNVAGLRRSLMGNLKAAEELSLKSLLSRIEELEAWAAARPVQSFKRKG